MRLDGVTHVTHLTILTYSQCFNTAYRRASHTHTHTQVGAWKAVRNITNSIFTRIIRVSDLGI